MKKNLELRDRQRSRRTKAITRKIRGTSERPRLTVHKSNKYLFAQIINDEEGKTLASLSSKAKDVKVKGKNKAAGKNLGEQLAKLAKDRNIDKLVFDRRHRKYHGTLAELTNAVRESGINI